MVHLSRKSYTTHL